MTLFDVQVFYKGKIKQKGLGVRKESNINQLRNDIKKGACVRIWYGFAL